MKGFNAALKTRGAGLVGLSKISVQTGTAHGGFINADGTLRMDVKIDLEDARGAVARRAQRLRARRRGAARRLDAAGRGVRRVPEAPAPARSTSRPTSRTWSTSTPQFPADSEGRDVPWVRANATEERKPKDTEEQFIYKARKKAIGPFKQKMWGLPEDARRAIGQSLEDQFTFLMTKLKINDTAAAVAKFVTVPQIALDRNAEIVAAGGTITAAEKKAEGLAD